MVHLKGVEIMKKNIYLPGIILTLTPLMANAAGAIDALNTSFQSAINMAATTLQTTAILWLSSFVLIQFVITNIGLLKSGADIEAVIGKFMGSMLWFGFCFYVMLNGVDFIDKVSQGFFTTAGSISGAGRFDAGTIIDQGATYAGNLITAINEASGITDLFAPALLGGLLGCVILATAALIAFKVFLIKIEVMIIIMMAPLSFAFLGLNALKDQGIAPFKALVSLLYRVILIALILKTMEGMSNNLSSVTASINSDSIADIWSVLFAAVIGYVLLGFLAFKSDSIASSLASGSTNLGTGDVAAAAAIGAAAGAAIGTGGVAVAGAAASGSGSMGNFIKSLGGAGAGSVSDASSRGTGPSPVGNAPTNPSMSLGGGEQSNKPPKRPEGSNESAIPSLSTPLGVAPSADSNSSNFATPSSPESGANAATDSSSFTSPAPSSPESGANAAIAGAASPMEQQIGDLVKSLNQPKEAQKTSFTERMGALNQHMAQEKADTHVSINTNNSE